MVTVKTYVANTKNVGLNKECAGVTRVYKTIDDAITACFAHVAVKQADFAGDRFVVVYVRPESGESYVSELQLTGDDLPSAIRWKNAMADTHFFISPEDIKKIKESSVVTCYHAKQRGTGGIAVAHRTEIFEDPLTFLEAIKDAQIEEITSTKYLINIYIYNKNEDTVDRLAVCKGPGDNHFVNLLMALASKAQLLSFAKKKSIDGGFDQTRQSVLL